MRRLLSLTLLTAALLLTTAACNPREEPETTLLIAAAASLEQVLERELIPRFESIHPGITVRGAYGGSYHLRTQIQHGLPADLFFPASQAAMAGIDLYGEALPLIENTLVLIAPRGGETVVTGFHDIQSAAHIAVGDPELVPAGRYAQAAFEDLGIWDDLRERASFGTSVSAVLHWVAAGSAQVGVVYYSDALAQADQVSIIATAPPGSHAPILYPIGLLRASPNQAAAREFLEFLQSPEARAILEAHGFTPHS